MCELKWKHDKLQQQEKIDKYPLVKLQFSYEISIFYCCLFVVSPSRPRFESDTHKIFMPFR